MRFANRPALCSAPFLLAATASLGADSEGFDHFERYVRPLLVENCFACHGAGTPEPQGGLRLDSREAILEGGKTGPAVIPGRPGESRLLQVLTADSGVRMPPTGRLPDAQVAHVAKWIRMGIPFPGDPESDEAPAALDAEGLWSLRPPVNAEPPPFEGGWARTAIDRFIEARLGAHGLKPSPEASPATLLRRLHLDLTGIPPSRSQIEGFAADSGNSAYEARVDALLESNRFGERWARHWLDVARYSDEGSQARPFPIAWTYRDWVISAFNDDMPYDRFVMLQIAADLLGADRRHLAALGLLTVGLNGPRPTDVPENVDDRIDVITRGFLGLSVSCARCHDHKFDPIPQVDYYSLYGVLLNAPVSVDPVPIDVAGERPDSSFFSAKLAMRREWLDTYRRQRLEDHLREFRKPEVLALYLDAAWQGRGMSNRQLEQLSKERSLNLYLLERWRAYLSGLVGPSVAAFRGLDDPGGAGRIGRRMAEADSPYRWPDPEREALRLALRGTGSPTDVPLEDFWWVQNEGDSNVMKALRWQYHNVMFDWSLRGGPRHASVVREPAKLLPAHVFVRGNQHDKGPEVPRQFLSALPGHEPFRSGSGRLELAQAIASPQNPLTARVMVNRVWGRLFGEGIVGTPSDFGRRGDRPSHPALLDYLTDGFIAGGWSIKGLVKRIVMSRAYRQESRANAAGAAEDPANRLLWRQNRFRLDFEALRDSMLFVAGRLDDSSGGPPFDLRAVPSSGRRTVYAYVSREQPSALMRTFDFSNPEEHTPRRQVTTVPQQALFLMNGGFVAEQARALADSCDSAPECVERIHWQVLGRQPTAAERSAAQEFLARAEPTPDPVPPQSAWSHGTARIDPATGAAADFREFRYRVGDRLQASQMRATAGLGRASVTAEGGYPGDGLGAATVRRWTAPAAMRVSVKGTLSHALGSQGRRFDYSNGVRGWLISSRQGLLGSWTVRGAKAETSFQDLHVADGEWFDFAVDSRQDYESDAFSWAPVVEELGEPSPSGPDGQLRVWSAKDGFPEPRESSLSPLQQYAQTLLMTNEFAFRE